MIAVESLTTKFGTCRVNNGGYWVVKGSTKEGNGGKLLHRLIYADYHNIELSNDDVIHHKDGNKLNNRINNLEKMSLKEHAILHSKDRVYTDEYKKNLRESHLGNKLRFESKLKVSVYNNNTGFFRVRYKKCKTCKQGFRWIYTYWENGKQLEISSVNLNKLKSKIFEKGLEWMIIDENKAKQLCEQYNYDIGGLV